MFNLTSDERFTSVVFNWGVPQMPNEVIISYEVTYRVGSDEPVTVYTTELTFTISELVPETIVSGISVTPFTSAGRGILTTHPDVVTSATPRPRELCHSIVVQPHNKYNQGCIWGYVTPHANYPSVCVAVVMNVEVEVLSATSVRVSWDRITDIDAISGYRVYYSPTESRRMQAEGSMDAPASESSVVIMGLSGGVEYQFHVVAIAEFDGQEVEGERSVTMVNPETEGNTIHMCNSHLVLLTND